MRRSIFISIVCASLATWSSTATAAYTLTGWNNLGMHCMDADFSVLSLLPPYNTIHAQLIDNDGRLVTDPAGIVVTYQAVADPDGSINTTSMDKGNFWTWAQELFGLPAPLPDDVGLAGKAMPGASNAPQPMTWDPAAQWFIAEGIPITPYDDAGRKNPYPLMRLVARSTGGTVLAQTDIVLPVSDEMDCRACHASGSGPAAQPAAGWVNDSDVQRDFRLNILRLHDERQQGNPVFTGALATLGLDPQGLYATVQGGSRAILCASCHLSEALPGSGQPGVAPLTQAMHAFHAHVTDPVAGGTLDSADARSACYRCHPGSVTRCLRGAMGGAVAADGTLAMQCQSCHGTMSKVGAPGRTGWLEEPACQSCHTGTATRNAGAIRFTSAFDAAGAPRAAVDPIFATTPDVPAPGLDLYRFSTGHGGLKCEACHGSTHAEFPSTHRNDNLQSIALQGHVGTLVECATCHGGQPMTVRGGPHGMHPVGQAWVGRHSDVVEDGGAAACRDCHGADYRGTALSRVHGDRTLTAFGTKYFWRGFEVGCYTCHNGPGSEDPTSNHAPVVQDARTTTPLDTPVARALVGNDADRDALTFRIVSQPAHGTVALAGTAATYFPDAGFTGTDTFTFAASDHKSDSNLGIITVVVGGGVGPGQQLVGTKLLLVKNPGDLQARTITYRVQERGGASLIGDPTTGGATLRVVLTPGGDQCFDMPAAGWAALGSRGFRYRDRSLTAGPVRSAQIKTTAAGAFVIRVTMSGRSTTPIGVTPGNPTAAYATNFALGGGDEYCSGAGTTRAVVNDAKKLRIVNDAAPAACAITSCAAP